MQAVNLSSVIDRLKFYLSAFSTLIRLSIHRIQEGGNSAVYDLYNLAWFVNIWNNAESTIKVEGFHTLRDELALTLFEACLMHEGERDHLWI